MFRYTHVTHPMKPGVAAAEGEGLGCRGVMASHSATHSSCSARSAQSVPYALVGSIEHTSSEQ